MLLDVYLLSSRISDLKLVFLFQELGGCAKWLLVYFNSHLVTDKPYHSHTAILISSKEVFGCKHSVVI